MFFTKQWLNFTTYIELPNYGLLSLFAGTFGIDGMMDDPNCLKCHVYNFSAPCICSVCANQHDPITFLSFLCKMLVYQIFHICGRLPFKSTEYIELFWVVGRPGPQSSTSELPSEITSCSEAFRPTWSSSESTEYLQDSNSRVYEIKPC